MFSRPLIFIVEPESATLSFAHSLTYFAENGSPSVLLSVKRNCSAFFRGFLEEKREAAALVYQKRERNIKNTS